MSTIRSRIRWEMSVQPSFTRSTSVKPPVCRVAKLINHSRCQPGPSPAKSSGPKVRLARTSTDDGVRWNTCSSAAEVARCGIAWTAVAPVPMMPTRLSANPVIGAPAASPPV